MDTLCTAIAQTPEKQRNTMITRYFVVQIDKIDKIYAVGGRFSVINVYETRIFVRVGSIVRTGDLDLCCFSLPFLNRKIVFLCGF